MFPEVLADRIHRVAVTLPPRHAPPAAVAEGETTTAERNVPRSRA